MARADKPKTAAYRLFHFRYLMRMPRMYLYGRNYLEKVGYSISGDNDIDTAAMSQMEIVNQTPAALAMLHAEGCPISLIKIEDAVPIYEDIQEHLRDWEKLINLGVHPSDIPPVEEFRQLEAIAMTMYPLAKRYTPEEKHLDPLRDRIMAMNMSRNRVGTETMLRRGITNEHGELKPYRSIVDLIEREVARGQKQWR